MKQVTIYTDGACSGNPGPGGWGAVLIYEGNQREISGGAVHTTNNRMELSAALEALRALKEPCHVLLHSDSAYLVNAFEKHWLQAWERNGWKTASKNPVENQDLWQDLLVQTKQHVVEFVKVKGHSANELNNRCDELARTAVKNLPKGGDDLR